MGSFLADVQGTVLLIMIQACTGMWSFCEAHWCQGSLVMGSPVPVGTRPRPAPPPGWGRGLPLFRELTNHISSHPCAWNKGCSGRRGACGLVFQGREKYVQFKIKLVCALA